MSEHKATFADRQKRRRNAYFEQRELVASTQVDDFGRGGAYGYTAAIRGSALSAAPEMKPKSHRAEKPTRLAGARAVIAALGRNVRPT